MNIFQVRSKLNNYKSPLLKREFLEYQLSKGKITSVQYNILSENIGGNGGKN